MQLSLDIIYFTQNVHDLVTERSTAMQDYFCLFRS